MDEIDFNTLTFIKETINTVKDANIDDKEEYLNTNETTNHVKINKKLNCKDKANNLPRYVASPLPHLNFNQRGKI